MSPVHHDLQEGEDDADHYFAYALSETSNSFYQRDVYVDTIGDNVGSLLQRLKQQEEQSKQKQALLEK